ncbi:hypothetical protein BC940DRAFT_293022 [Gongronella butleri]|nr:hypothetical protein BC940DRAFT_293022 [Gongronella butleri]
MACLAGFQIQLDEVYFCPDPFFFSRFFLLIFLFTHLMGPRWLLVTLVAAFLVLVVGYPSAPGTCHLDRMAVIGHGRSKSTCEGCYRFVIDTSSASGAVRIRVEGTRTFQGLMLMVKDSQQRTVGEFVDFDESLLAPVACDDDDDEHQGEETTAVLGHVDPHLKSWPIDVSWRPNADVAAQQPPLQSFELQGMVVIDYDNFHMIPPASFRIKHHPIPPPAANSTSASAMEPTKVEKEAKQPTLLVEQDDPHPPLATDWPVASPNPFFLSLLFGLFGIYFGMVLLLRYRRHRHQNARRTSLTTTLDI